MNYNFCFDAATPVIYKTSLDGEIIIESVKDAYSKHADDVVYVCGYSFDEHNHTAKLMWTKSRMCLTKSIREVEIYLTPMEFLPALESDNIIRVTPNHIFPILTKNGYSDTEAYLLQTGDKMISERCRVVSDADEIPVDEDNQPFITWMLDNDSEHFIDYRHILKIVTNDIEETDFYGFIIEPEENIKYFMLCNGIISHDSSVA